MLDLPVDGDVTALSLMMENNENDIESYDYCQEFMSTAKSMTGLTNATIQLMRKPEGHAA